MERNDLLQQIPDLRPLVGGERLEDAGLERCPVEDPARAETIAEVPMADAAAVGAAVDAAAAAFEGPWAEVSPRDRGHLLNRLATLIADEAELLGGLETLDTGKPFAQARGIDVAQAVEAFSWFGGLADKVEGRVISLRDPALQNLVTREPVGVVGAIIPWNFPLLMAAWKLAPALAAGCSVVLKVSELTPLSAGRLAELVVEAGFPAGTVNILCGRGEVAGRALVDHPRVDKLAFTGSTEVGREILERSAPSLKRVSLELGGKCANLVFADVPDLDRAATRLVQAAFYNQGECCTAGSRALVERSIYEGFVARLVERAKAFVAGDPFLQRSAMGALISEAHRERVHGFVSRASDARCLVGGEADGERAGYFYPATVLAGLAPDAEAAQEEIFGPVLGVIPFDDEEEAIAIAEGTRYGLAAGVWSGDAGRARRIARRLRCGTVWINGYNRFDAASPFGGFKASGIGRENGLEALALYTESKSLWTEDPS